MAKSRGVDAKLAHVRSLREASLGAAAVPELREALIDRSNHVAAEAAAVIGDLKLADLSSDLVGAFNRFMEDPEETDKVCRAKIAIVDALNKLEYPRDDVFLRGIVHVQGMPFRAHETDDDDHAAPLRGSSAFGLVRIKHVDALLLLVDLLRDRAKTARLCAVQALGAGGKLAAIPLLRFKALEGDRTPGVVAECCSALLQLDASESIPFVARFLSHGDAEISEGAALALGESRRPEAFEVLKRCFPAARSRELQETLLLAMSLSRLQVALDFLFEIVAKGEEPASPSALAALAVHRHNPRVKDRAAELAAKGSRALRAMFERKFRE